MTVSPDPVPKTTPDHAIILVPPVGQFGREQLLQECYDIRINVFHHEQGYSPDVVIDKLRLPSPFTPLSSRFLLNFPLPRRLDETAEQFLLRLLPSLQPIGTVRVSRASSGGAPYYKLGRLAVLKEFRKHNFGGELVLALHKWVAADSQSRGEHSAKVICHSQTPVKAFYVK